MHGNWNNSREDKNINGGVKMEKAVKEILSTVLVFLLTFSIYYGMRIALHTDTPLVVVIQLVHETCLLQR
ncbi:hypothetical protein PF0314 [Pyrococcus furiosus DSM 3638]|uniref:Uncharacterized protein n=1 Tax=Pyrococcus furiosus (strain ATCC 43587 / DSM 3638 / JCM 8422 / Vc1) TaxID=186497 RepID=Q8U3Y7_PYRFU|nr:hypothetical protein PF0314 [Pyrococcus furiosus DSM 3638]